MPKSRTPTWDPKCQDLAEHFAQDNPRIPVEELAHAIQQAVEDFVSDYDDPTPYCMGCGARHLAQCTCGPIAENE